MPSHTVIERLQRIDDIPTEFIGEVSEAQRGIFDGIIKKLNKLSLDADGNVLLNQSNLAKIDSISKDFEKLMIGKGSGYSKAVKGFLGEMKNQKDLNKLFFEGAFDFENKAVFDTMFKTAQDEAANLLANAAVDQNVGAFRDLLQRSISSSDSYTEMLTNVRTLIEGDGKRFGGLERYARQNANDIFAIADREYVNAVAADLGVVFHQYVGGLVKDSRSFCVERNGGVYHENEIASWSNQQWQGKAAGTTSSTIFSLLGGYNCQHVLIPVGIEEVPEDVLARNLAMGNIILDDLPEEIRETFV